MNNVQLELVKRVVALQRKRAGYVGLLRQRVLTQEECDALCLELDAQIASARRRGAELAGQLALPSVEPGSPAGALAPGGEPGGGRGRSPAKPA